MSKKKIILQLIGLGTLVVGLYIGSKMLNVGTEVTDNYTIHSRNLWPSGRVEYYKYKTGEEVLEFNSFKKKIEYTNFNEDPMPEEIDISTQKHDYLIPAKVSLTFKKDYEENKPLFDEGKKLILEERVRYE